MTRPIWRKSSHSGVQEGNCVEVAALAPIIGVRDSKNPALGHISVRNEDFNDLLASIKRGELDHDRP